jgi:hypothetical protein
MQIQLMGQGGVHLLESMMVNLAVVGLGLLKSKQPQEAREGTQGINLTNLLMEIQLMGQGGVHLLDSMMVNLAVVGLGLLKSKQLQEAQEGTQGINLKELNHLGLGGVHMPDLMNPFDQRFLKFMGCQAQEGILGMNLMSSELNHQG